MKRHSLSSVFAVVLILPFLAGCGSPSRLKIGKTADGEVVEAEGFAPHNPQDMLQTKRGSLVDAQRNAVEKAVGVFVSGKTLVEKAVAIENNILAKTDGYVKKYDVLSEGVQGDLYRTRIRALVALKDLERDLKDMSLITTPELKRPRVTVSLSEEVGKAMYDDDAAAATALAKSLSEHGFVVVSGDRRKEAELAITGKASSFPFQASGLGGFVSYRARLTVQAKRMGADDVMLSLSKEASGLGGNAELAALKSLETVGELVGSELAAQLPEAWIKGKSALVFVEGVQSFSHVERIRKHLAAQPGVSDLVLRFYDEAMAQFEIELGSIGVNELAAALDKSQSLPMRVIETKSNTIRLTAK